MSPAFCREPGKATIAKPLLPACCHPWVNRAATGLCSARNWTSLAGEPREQLTTNKVVKHFHRKPHHHRRPSRHWGSRQIQVGRWVFSNLESPVSSRPRHLIGYWGWGDGSCRDRTRASPTGKESGACSLNWARSRANWVILFANLQTARNVSNVTTRDQPPSLPR